MTTASALERGREAFGQDAWADSCAELEAADREATLALADLERLAVAMYLTGRDKESVAALLRAHQEALRQGDPVRAVRSAFWLGFQLVNSGDMAQGGGWLGRARRLLDDHPQDCAEAGYLLLPEAIQRVDADPAGALAAFSEAASIGDRFREPDLMALGRLGRGRAMVRLGRARDGMAQLDEAMVAVTAGEVSPIVVGVVYCAVIEVCHLVLDLRRAQEWTAALSRWCEAHPDLVPFRGQCMVYRAEIMQLRGAWEDALKEAQRAWERLSKPPPNPGVGPASYQQGELYRLRGEFAKAETAYRQASQWGRQPEPGMALLRLAQGRVEVAAASIRRAMGETRERIDRSKLLAAHVEVMLAAGDLPAARLAADELSAVAVELDAPLLHATAAQAEGAVRLADGDARAALAALRQAAAGWSDLAVPYEVARTRVLIGRACGALGDADTGEMELDAARGAFRRLGAAPDLAALDAPSTHPARAGTGGLTAREVEVLRLVAAGNTNRAIASELVISEKTVARHVSNIFAKLDLSSRSAATAYAYEHDLV
ncbi:MAG: DNA-binding response regulator [Dehalococcoidia bacterium]|nr:DNA-binding response regulator [Dehalococcoidia bacterium]